MAFGPSFRYEQATAHSTDRQLCCRAKADASCAPHRRAGPPARKRFAANTQPFDQLLVTPIVRAPKIIENLATLRHELEQAAPRMVVFDMCLEVARQVVDPLREQCNLDFGRAGIAGFDGVRLITSALRSSYRHRH